MSETVETIMTEVVQRTSTALGFQSFFRSEVDQMPFEKLPALRVVQGAETITHHSLGQYECALVVSMEIVCGKGAENIETTLNKLHRNLLQVLFATGFATFDLVERVVEAPSIVQEDGQIAASMICQFEVVYTKAIHDL